MPQKWDGPIPASQSITVILKLVKQEPVQTSSDIMQIEFDVEKPFAAIIDNLNSLLTVAKSA